VFAALVEASPRALSQAQSGEVVAALEAGVGDARALVANRNQAEVDGRLVSIRLLGAGGAPVGEVALLGSHPTLLGMDNRRISGDWPGALMRSRPAPLLFFQGALGDQTTHGPGDEATSPEAYARAVGARLAAAPRSAPDGAPPFGLARAAVALPRPSPGALPAFLRRIAGRLFAGVLPGEAEVTALRLGPLLLLATPAEPTARVAAAWRAEAGPGAEILSLAGPYTGYAETPERMARGEGETVRTYYGPELAARLGDGAALAGRAADGAR
jgi:neutral ceramidase